MVRCALCDHIEGLPEIKKNFYIEDPQVSQMTPQEVNQIRYITLCACAHVYTQVSYSMVSI